MLKSVTLGLCLVSATATYAQQVKPLYKDNKAPTEARVQDLLGRMTVEEKVGQLSTILGWEMYQKDGKKVGISAAYKKAVDERHIGGLWATLRADPWTQKTLANGLNPTQAAEASNALQKYATESTRLGIPLFLAEECPHGHMAIGATVFPTSIGQGSTWDPALVQRMAAAIATEVRVQGGHIGYGPVLDLAREPRWSRVEETYGEDPVLTSQMGVAMVRGLQGASLKSGVNVISTLKHFAAYGVPEGGHNGGSISTGYRELYQSFLPPVHAAVKAGVLSIMTSYNSIDGVPCSSNEFLLTDLLRRQWGFQGFTVSDLGSISGILTSHHVAGTAPEAAALAINAGLDDDLSGYGFDKELLAAYNQKLVSMETLDRAVGRVLRLKFEMGLFENPYVDARKAARQVNSAANVELARQVARESVVLLKNEKDLLPLSKSIQRIAVIGPNADNIYNQLGDYTAPQPESNIVTVLEGIKSKVAAGTKVTYVKGCAIRDTTQVDIAAAVSAARNADVAVVVLGGSSARDFKTDYQSTGAANVTATGTQALSDMESGEGYDRATLDLLGKQQELLQAVVQTGKPVVVVLIKGRPLNLNWMAAHVPALLDAWYPGQEGGNAIADVLFGDYNPAGRLPISVPKHVGQLPVYYNAARPARRDYVEMDAKPLYSFGYGLSYSKFEYSDLQVNPTESKDAVKVVVRFKVKNTSTRDGDEVAQLYLTDEVSSVVTPVQQLKKFQRLRIKAGAQQEVAFELTAEDLMLLNQKMEWVVEPGTFTAQVGASSDDVRLKQTFQVAKALKLASVEK
ncbi:glycoside hydrolase family 3 C-terminal domain-containing protein [Hymenobacter sp. BT186]|uniref:Glycoside hydrolase family 3 C-terminal domain-containing protein n=1 Tax=Hymenobacter telluris TaxID=2816474 RepID=A0A939EWZ8_9BACT|nr:glycoside hydrolase family 3 N-terminal domain-containing protein [Hymenobacter telluris]MBO0358581.1 glycoside hydrolase family 3 C-terminal domain-containing protein [Hymenobacter telluris]MBW3374607.1 glycoside hydrolase family 3 C-terminal domain-containing protein [Hymenobacter norwichensis]